VENWEIIVEQNRKFRERPLGVIFYPKWMAEISKKFEEMLLEDGYWQ